MLEMKNLWFSVGLCTINFLLCGCASTKYQEAYSLSELAKRIDQAPIENKQSASRFIEQQTQYILSLEKNDKVKSQAYISITHPSKLQEKKTEIWVKTKNNNGVCTIHFYGSMPEGTEYAFYKVAKYAIQQKCTDVLLKLSSSGGSLRTGIAIGLSAKIFGWSTLAWRADDGQISACVSACAIAYLGGKKRYVYSGFSLQSDIGFVFFHQLSKLENEIKKCITDPSDQGYTLLNAYLSEVFPENTTLVMGKILNEPCNTANQNIGVQEILSSYFRDKYTSEIFQKYK
jgi:hypothetical protein